MRKHTIPVLLMAMLCQGAAQAADGPPVEMIAMSCAGCHGQEGFSQNPLMPTLAGLDAAYFVDDMLAFQAGEIQSPMMRQIAGLYSRDQLEALANYYAALPYQPMKQAYDADKAKRGEPLHERYCAICHHDGGSSEAARQWSLAPLAGQGSLYLRTAIDAYRKGTRPMPYGMSGPLEAMMRSHGDDGLDDLLNYYASQQ